MDTRVTRTDIWDRKEFYSLSNQDRYVYLFLLTNEKIGQSRIYLIPDGVIAQSTSISKEQLVDTKNALEINGLVYFKDDYVFIASNVGYVAGNYNTDESKIRHSRDLCEIPEHVLLYFIEQIPEYALEVERIHSEAIIAKERIDERRKNKKQKKTELETSVEDMKNAGIDIEVISNYSDAPF